MSKSSEKKSESLKEKYINFINLYKDNELAKFLKFFSLKRTTDYKPTEGMIELIGEFSVENCYQGKVGN